MPTYSQNGRFAAVNGIVAVSKWGVNETSSPVAIYNSASGRLPLRSHGPKSWNGSIGIDGCNPVALPGQTIAFDGYAYPSNGVKNAAGLRHSGIAVIDSMNMSFDWKTNKPVSYTLAFSGAGALTINNAGAAIAPSGTYTPFEVCGESILFRTSTDSGDAAEVEKVTTATLNLTASNGKVSNSETGCRVDTVPGNADCTLSISVETGNRQLVLGELYEITLPSSPSPWVLRWMRLKAFSNFNVDLASNTIIGQTMEFEYSGLKADGVKGAILLPSGSEWDV